jgi:hypothetical protein
MERAAERKQKYKSSQQQKCSKSAIVMTARREAIPPRKQGHGLNTFTTEWIINFLRQHFILHITAFFGRKSVSRELLSQRHLART